MDDASAPGRIMSHYRGGSSPSTRDTFTLRTRLGDCSALGGHFAFGRDGILNLILGSALTPKVKHSINSKRPEDFLPRSMRFDSYDEPHSGSAEPTLCVAPANLLGIRLSPCCSICIRQHGNGLLYQRRHLTPADGGLPGTQI